jgi:DNA repair protein RAD5
MVDCPATLAVGVELIVSLDVYIKTPAFQPSNAAASDDHKYKAMFNEGEETADEYKLRGRKLSLGKMFHMLGLHPQTGGRAARKHEEDLSTSDLSDMVAEATRVSKEKTQAEKGKPRTEIVGDGEEVEIDDGDGELSDNQLDVIYRKYVAILGFYPSFDSLRRAQANDRAMGEMEAAPSFTMSLRGYQKQALLFVQPFLWILDVDYPTAG